MSFTQMPLPIRRLSGCLKQVVLSPFVLQSFFSRQLLNGAGFVLSAVLGSSFQG
jgi:hypothetical protein